MQPQVLRPRLRAVYRVPVELALDLVMGVLVGASVLAMSMSIVFTFDAAMTGLTSKLPILKAPVLTPPSLEEVEMPLRVTVGDGFSVLPDDIYVFNTGSSTLGDSIATFSAGNMTINGVVVLQSHDDEKSCTLTIDALNGVRQECDYVNGHGTGTRTP